MPLIDVFVVCVSESNKVRKHLPQAYVPLDAIILKAHAAGMFKVSVFVYLLCLCMRVHMRFFACLSNCVVLLRLMCCAEFCENITDIKKKQISTYKGYVDR